MNVTDWPEHTELPEPEAIVTAGVIAPEILMVIAFEVALVEITHCEFETILQVTTSPLVSVVEVYVAAVAPLIALLPSYH